MRNNRQSDWQIDKNSWYSDIGHTVSNKTVLCSTIVSLAFLQCISQRFLVGGIVLLIILNYGRNIVSRDWLLRRTLRLKHSSLRVRWDPAIANFGPGEVLQGLDVMWDTVQGHRHFTCDSVMRMILLTRKLYRLAVCQWKDNCNSTTFHTLSIHNSCQMHVIADGECSLSFNSLLEFMTGASTVPPLGFDKYITIDFYDKASSNHYPTVSTCDMHIWLPRGTEPEELQRLMQEAVACSPGFGKI